jgi:hypothetical protein
MMQRVRVGVRHGVSLDRGTMVKRVETGWEMGKAAPINGIEATLRCLGAEELHQVRDRFGLARGPFVPLDHPPSVLVYALH